MAAMSDEPRYRDGEWLREQYVEKEQSTYDIAEKCGCSDSTVRNWMDDFNISRRRDGPQLKNERLRDAKWLREQYVENGKSCKEIAQFSECTAVTVYNYLQKHEIDTRRPVKDERLRDAEWLRKQYLDMEKSGVEIARELGCTNTVVYRWLEKHGIDRVHTYRGATGSDHPSWQGGRVPYGPGWNKAKRQSVRERDDHTCQDPRCSVTQDDHSDEYGEKLHVHHLRKAREVDDPERRNAKKNLITLCRDCHKRWEKIADAGLVPQMEVAHD